MSICQWRLDGFSQKYIDLYIFILGLFFENRKNSGLTPGQNDEKMTWKMTQMTHWPGDPITQFHVCSPVGLFAVSRFFVAYGNTAGLRKFTAGFFQLAINARSEVFFRP